MEKITFIASLPAIQSAIQLDGQGDGARIKLDIPRNYTFEVLKLQRLAGFRLKITVEPDNEQPDDEDRGDFFS